jgi:hypothetical protein
METSLAVILSRSMHYERAPHFKGLNVGMAPPPLRYAVQGLRSAAAAQGERCVRRRKLARSSQNG